MSAVLSGLFTIQINSDSFLSDNFWPPKSGEKKKNLDVPLANRGAELEKFMS
jgi:hypothetical protein